MTTPTLGEPAAATRSRARSMLTLTVEIVTVLGAIGGLLVWLGVLPIGASGEAGPGPAGTPSTVAAATSTTGASPGRTTATPALVYLDTLAPIAGGSRRTDLPKQLVGESGMDRAIAIKCPSNNTGDRAASVTYELRKNYSTFTATVVAHRNPPDRVLVDFTAFRESFDGLPGAPNQEPSTKVRLEMGQSQPFTLDVSQTYKLRLQVECQLPGGIVIFAAAGLTQQ